MVKKTKIILLSIGIVLCFSAIIFGKINKSSFVQTLERPKMDDDFETNNFNVIDVDSFIKITQAIYKTELSVIRQDGELLMSLKSKENDLSSFYNNNESLLKVRKHGFKITQENSILTASFQVKNNAVNVPNDVLINIAKRIQKEKTHENK